MPLLHFLSFSSATMPQNWVRCWVLLRDFQINIASLIFLFAFISSGYCEAVWLVGFRLELTQLLACQSSFCLLALFWRCAHNKTHSSGLKKKKSSLIRLAGKWPHAQPGVGSAPPDVALRWCGSNQVFFAISQFLSVTSTVLSPLAS